MSKKIEKILKGYLPGFILGVISACTMSVIAATYFPGNDVTYDNSVSGLQSTNVQGAIDELYNTCFPKRPMDQIIDNGKLEKDSYECRYFFTGENPNNYITFNNEKNSWRILSVECDGRIKIIRDTSIGNREYAEFDTNNKWENADLNTYLNNTYYNNLNSTAKSQIVNSNFSIGEIEHGETSLETQINKENQTTWNGKIALPTASEFIRTNSNKNSCGTFSLNNNNFETCKNTTWLYYSSTWWTLTPPEIYFNKMFSVIGVSLANTKSIGESLAIHPTLYLKSDIKITGGDGTQDNPYTIE